MSRILCFDQATKDTGFCIMENGEYVDSGVISVNRDADVMTRLMLMNEKLIKIIDSVKPTWVVFENIQYQQNQKTYKVLAQLQGILMAHLFNVDCGFTIIEASTWKSFCGIKSGKRDAQKKETQRYVEDIYNISASEDEADAIGIATWAINNLEE